MEVSKINFLAIKNTNTTNNVNQTSISTGRNLLKYDSYLHSQKTSFGGIKELYENFCISNYKKQVKKLFLNQDGYDNSDSIYPDIYHDNNKINKFLKNLSKENDNIKKAVLGMKFPNGNNIIQKEMYNLDCQNKRNIFEIVKSIKDEKFVDDLILGYQDKPYNSLFNSALGVWSSFTDLDIEDLNSKELVMLSKDIQLASDILDFTRTRKLSTQEKFFASKNYYYKNTISSLPDAIRKFDKVYKAYLEEIKNN